MFASTLVASFFAVAAFATPIVKPSDIDILQYALTLEHLENAFYSEALGKFDEQAFADAGFAPLVRQRFAQIASHEVTHVNFLTEAISGAGATPTQACNYNFPYTDVKSFATLSQLLEGVGVSAYIGAAQFLTNPDHLTVAASILSTEGRHNAWVAASVNQDTPWSGPFDVALDLDQVFSLATTFITTCPSSNPSLPVKAFPTLGVSSSRPTPGSEITLTFEATSEFEGDTFFLAILTELSTEFLTITNNQVTLPSTLTGTVYAVVTTNDDTVTDDVTVAGPAVMFFPDNE